MRIGKCRSRGNSWWSNRFTINAVISELLQPQNIPSAKELNLQWNIYILWQEVNRKLYPVGHDNPIQIPSIKNQLTKSGRVVRYYWHTPWLSSKYVTILKACLIPESSCNENLGSILSHPPSLYMYICSKKKQKEKNICMQVSLDSHQALLTQCLCYHSYWALFIYKYEDH